MKTAKIKRSRKKRDFFLLEHVDVRVSVTHDKLVGYRQKGIPLKTTKTILDEFNHDKTRRITDEKCHFLNFAQREFLIRQILKEKEKIISKFSPYFNIKTSDIRDLLKNVTDFYQDPKKKDRLEKLRKRKGVTYFLPEPNDKTILAECCHLKGSERKDITLLTDDGHFTEFSREIKNDFDIEIDAIL